MPAPLDALRRRAESAEDDVVVVDEVRSWTAARLLASSTTLAAGLAAQQVGPGSRVALHLHNTVEAVLAYLACQRLGAVAVPLNTRLAAPELTDLLTRTSPAAYLGDAGLYESACSLPDVALPLERRFLVGGGPTGNGGPRPSTELAGPADALPTASVSSHDPALLLSTSGTTSRSKLVVWDGAVLDALALSAAERGIRAGSVLPITTPLMHGAAVYHLFNAITQDATAVLVRSFDADLVLDAVEQQRATSVFALPFMWSQLADRQARRPRATDSLDKLTVGGDVCPAEVEDRVRRLFGLPLLSYWAAAEDVGATVPVGEPGPFMRVLPQASTRILSVQDGDVARGEVGELLVSSPTTSPGYWDEPGTSALDAHGFRSGDLVTELRPGVLRYAGRSKDLIVRGGSNIAPQEVEEVLRAYPGVVDVGVAGYPDAELGQRVGAVLVGVDSSTDLTTDLRRWATGRLASYKVPDLVVAVPAVPRNRLTKVDRNAVTALLAR